MFRRFPRKIENHRYCYEWYSYVVELRQADRFLTDVKSIPFPVESRVLFDPWRCALGTKCESGLIDGLIPAIRLGNYIGLYRITSDVRITDNTYHPRSWDDGHIVSLSFVKRVRVPVVKPKLKVRVSP
jgi:hypothetical protein